MNTSSRLFAWVFVGATGLCIACYLLMAMTPRTTDSKDFNWSELGRLPVVDHGRVKPLDTLARISLMILSGKQEYKDEKGDTQPAIRWLFDVMTAGLRQEPTRERPIPGDSRLVKAYRVEDPGVRKTLKLEEQAGVVFSFEEIYKAAGAEGLKKFFDDAADLGSPDSEELNDRDRAVAELAVQLRGHLRLSPLETSHRVFRIDNDQVLALLGLEARPGFRYGLDEFLPRLSALEREARRAKQVKPRDQSVYDRKAFDTFRHVDLYVGLARGSAETLHLIPPSAKGGEWRTLPDALEAMQGVERNNAEALAPHTSTVAFRLLLDSYASGDKAQFNKIAERYQKVVSEALPGEVATASTEASFNAFAPFYHCTVLYGLIFVIACVSWLWGDPVINRYAFWLTVLAVLIHTWALVTRMYIQGRPPVTNLYSSAVFIGWVSVLVCLVVEWIYRNGIATAAAALIGFATLLMAHHLGGSGDTLEMMQAVLDTNFWLATHVTTVTMGYASTFVAGAIGFLLVLLVVLVTILKALGQKVELTYPVMKMFGQIIYGVVCFAMLFSFVGTVLGGIWADVSWGRFWGWDPKENGALLIVIMNALILHARWAGLVKERGMAVLAMCGNMVTMWSWFGTNQLGIGLHAYGFNNTLVLVCRYFWLLQLGVIGLALVPFKAWYPPYVSALKAPDAADPARPARQKSGRGRSASIVPAR